MSVSVSTTIGSISFTEPTEEVITFTAPTNILVTHSSPSKLIIEVR